MRVLSLLLFLGLIVSWTGVVSAQEGESRNRPLDLPAAGSGEEEEEEDEPESITFYGAEFEGDGFFWCLDKSCSMGWAPDMPTLKNECTGAISQLSARAEFGVVAFSSGVTQWNGAPKKANMGNRASASSWVQTLSASGTTCLADGAVSTIGVANQSTKRNKQILILGDGVPFCGGGEGGTEGAITAANYQRIEINCIFISADPSGISLFQAIAAANGGTYTSAN